MKKASKNKARKITKDEDGPPPVKRTADEFDTAYFLAEASLNEPSEPTSPAPTEEPPAPVVVLPPIAPMAALWPSTAPSQGASMSTESPATQVQNTAAKAATPQVSPAPGAQGSKPPAEPEATKSPGKASEATKASMPPLSSRVKVTFVLLDLGATQVSLTGDFNGWASDGTPMKRDEGGSWETTLELAPGRYEYKFIVDGQWIPNPLAREHVWNRHGTLNSVIEVRA